MSIWKPTLVLGCALGTLITVGVVTTAAGDHDNRGNSISGLHQQLPQHDESKTGSFEHPVYGNMFKHPVHGYMFKHPTHGYKLTHPVYGQMFKHPVHGYKFKHPVHGYIRVSAVGQGSDDKPLSAADSESESVGLP